MPPLLPTIAHITGDYSLLRDDLKPDPLLIRDIQGGMTEAQQSQARDQAPAFHSARWDHDVELAGSGAITWAVATACSWSAMHQSGRMDAPASDTGEEGTP